MIAISSECTPLSVGREVNGAWIVSVHPLRLFHRDQAVTALTPAERLAAGFGDNDPFVKTWRNELFL
jgi:hypothetical protein